MKKRATTVQGDGATPVPVLLNANQAAKALAISPRKLWSMAANGEIPHVRFGRAVRFATEDLRELIHRKKEGGDKK